MTGAAQVNYRVNREVPSWKNGEYNKPATCSKQNHMKPNPKETNTENSTNEKPKTSQMDPVGHFPTAIDAKSTEVTARPPRFNNHKSRAQQQDDDQQATKRGRKPKYNLDNWVATTETKQSIKKYFALQVRTWEIDITTGNLIQEMLEDPVDCDDPMFGIVPGNGHWYKDMNTRDTHQSKWKEGGRILCYKSYGMWPGASGNNTTPTSAWKIKYTNTETQSFL